MKTLQVEIFKGYGEYDYSIDTKFEYESEREARKNAIKDLKQWILENDFSNNDEIISINLVDTDNYTETYAIIYLDEIYGEEC